MRPQSAKAKGRRAAQEVKRTLLQRFVALSDDDLLVTPSSVTGEDLKMSPNARASLPFVIEVKNQERINIWDALAQAKSHGSDRPELIPLVIFRRNHSGLHVALEWEHFLDLTQHHETHAQRKSA